MPSCRAHRSVRFGIPLAAALSLSTGCPGPVTQAPPDTKPGTPVSLQVGGYAVAFDPGARELVLRRGDAAILTLPADALQLGTVAALDEHTSYDPYWAEYGEDVLTPTPPEGLVWHTVQAARTLETPGPGQLAVALDFEGGLAARLELKAEAEGRFSARMLPDVQKAGRAVAFMRIAPRVGTDEGFYGLGEWADAVNHRGKVRPMQIELDVLESQNNENHVPVPLLIGTRGWGLFVESRRLGVFDVASRKSDRVVITYGTAKDSASGLRFHLFAAERPLDIVRRYYDVTGDPLLPAPWALGPWIWRNESKSQAELEGDIAQIRALDLATSAIWIDRPYATGVNSFDFEKARFPDPLRVIDLAHKAGLRMALWHTPYLDEKSEPYRSEARAAGYFPKTSGLLLNGWSEPFDFTADGATAYWQKLLRRYTDLGIEGFKLDYGEDIAPSFGQSRNVWEFRGGTDERTEHYDYTLRYHRAYAELLPRSGGFLLCRAGRWGDQKNVSVIWPGDMDASFARHREPVKDGTKTVLAVGGLPATVIQGVGLGASGFPFYGADTGGYRHSPPDKELYIRWFEQTALSTVMQVGDGSSQPPWVFTNENGRDTETLDLYRTYARLHLRLFPYEWTYAQNLKTDGRPLQRAVGLAYPELGAHPDDEYLFGDSLLVAPVVDRGVTRRKVLLPPGDWIDFWDGSVLMGGDRGREVEVAAPLAKLPLYLRAGGIVPLLRPTIDTLAPASDAGIDSFASEPGPLYVRMVPGPQTASFTLYDGTALSQSAAGGPLQLGLRPGSVFRAGAVLEVLRTAEPQGVLKDGAELPALASGPALEAAAEGWFWEAAAGGTLRVKLGPSAAARAITTR